MRDTPAYDLILVMDRYDEQEVLREVGSIPQRRGAAQRMDRMPGPGGGTCRVAGAPAGVLPPFPAGIVVVAALLAGSSLLKA